MAAEKWLEEELAELDQAEQFIQQSMSDFLPTVNGDDAKSKFFACSIKCSSLTQY